MSLCIFRYYRGTHGVIVVYDVTSAESFVNVKRWLHEINQNCDDVCRILGERVFFSPSVTRTSSMVRSGVVVQAVVCFLFVPLAVGNKNDDPNSKVVETTDAQKFAEQMGINLFETSAKENINVEEVARGARARRLRLRRRGNCSLSSPADVQLHHRAGAPSQEGGVSQAAAAATERRGQTHPEQ